MKNTPSALRAKSSKTVNIIARYKIKKDHSFRPLIGHVAYLVRSSDGQSEYCCTLGNGKATGCSCPARKPCYHMKQLEVIEAARVTKNDQIMSALCPVNVPAEEEEFSEGNAQRWVEEELSGERLTREQYDVLFDPNYLCCA